MKYLLYYEGKGRIINILDSTTKKEVDIVSIDFGEKSGHWGCGLPYSLEEFYKKELEGIYYNIDGHNVILFIFPENTKEQIESAKKYLFVLHGSIFPFDLIEVKEWI